MGFSQDVATVKGDLSTHAMEIFVQYFTKFPAHQNVFANYKGKAPASLKSMDVFKVHVTKVVTLLVAILEKADDAGALKGECEKLAKMQQHVGLNIQQFKDVGVVLLPYLQATLGGSCDSDAWKTKFNAFTSTLGPLM